MSNQTISGFYEHDHDRLDQLFQSFLSFKSSHPGKATAYFQEFKSGLEQHIAWEEEILFPAFETKTGTTGGPTQVMRWEHREIRKHLDAIAEKLSRKDFGTGGDETALLSVLGPHNEKEENILYPMIDQVTDGPERTQIFTEMERHPLKE